MNLLTLALAAWGGIAARPEPNGSKNPDEQVEISIEGLGAGDKVSMKVLLDCDGDGWPDAQAERPGCRSPSDPPVVLVASAAGHLRTTLNLGDLPGLQGAVQSAAAAGRPVLPTWVAVARGSDPPTLFALPVQVGVCNGLGAYLPWVGSVCGSALPPLMVRHKGLEPQRRYRVEVAADPQADNPPSTRILGTDDATGLWWDGPDALLVTLADGEGSRLARVPLTSVPSVLLRAEQGRILSAPARISPDELAAVETRSEGEGSAQDLVVWRGLQEEERIALPRRVERVLRVDGRRVLVEAGGGDQGELTLIDLDQKQAVFLGTDAGAYLAALRQPGGFRAVVPVQDNQGSGLGLRIVDTHAASLVVLRSPPHGQARGQTMDGSYAPDGTKIAFLAESPGGD